MKKLTALLLAVAMVAGCLSGCGGSKSGSEGNTDSEGITTVKIGQTPYSMYCLYEIANQWGIAKDFGINFEMTDFAGTANGAQALVRGDVEISSSCVNEHIACLETTEDLVNFSFLGDFLGFFFVGREKDVKDWDKFVEEDFNGDKAAAKEARLKEFKGTSWCVIPQRKALIVDAISQVGLTADDVKFIEFADDAKAAEAFIAGEGDYYTGGDQQQMALLAMGGYVNAGGSDILGPSGKWYDTFMTTPEWLEANYETAKKVYAVQLAAVEAFNANDGANVEAAAEIAAEYLKKATGSEYPVKDWIEAQTELDIYISMNDAETKVFNKDDPVNYWKGQAEYNVQMLKDEGSLTKDINVDDFYKQSEQLFKDVMADKDLVEKIKSYSTFTPQ